jgi:CDP-glucose 4,6-dehydratase
VHFLITGHTGFKGSWLIALLAERGHLVSGIGLNPLDKSIFHNSKLKELLQFDFRIDIRNVSQVEEAISIAQPDVVIHLAAQSEVLESYLIPVETFETNVVGTLNVLNCIQKVDSIKAAVIVTTDKVYKNLDSFHSYTEEDPLGGTDPYSASKSMADLLTQSWFSLYPDKPIGIARAGNVIGGGDCLPNRIIPHLINCIQSNQVPDLRNPNSIRPWQHVLDCLNGYLKLVDRLLLDQKSSIWNFGPSEGVVRTVRELAEEVLRVANTNTKWRLAEVVTSREQNLLLIDSKKARRELLWSEKFSFEESVQKTVEWYLNLESESIDQRMANQVRAFDDSQ